MARINIANAHAGILNAFGPGGQLRAKDQLSAMADALLQLVGNANVAPGSTESADPLSAPFTLYVNPYTGSDRFVGGSYNSFEASGTDEQIIAQKLKRIELQRLECGYTPFRPFKSINRAVIEAAIITSKNWYTYTDPRAHVDCVSIVLAPGVHILYNDPGSSSNSLASWGSSKDPTTAELIAFNPPTVGGVLLPRGCSLCGPDLRKVTIRPTWVPAAANISSDYSNLRGMLKITGTGYFFGFTVMDKIGLAASHHLLQAFHFASKAELDAFYAKCFSAVGSGADLSNALTATRGTEYEIVGPIVADQTPTSAWDTTASASPYIFNCSIRSDYGLGGAWMDGAKVGGLKSMVCANFTGVSLQKDMTCWQVYENGSWVSLTNTTQDYNKYISTPPDSVRMDPARLSRHISAINDAFIQEVSVFAIGHGIHHFTDLGGEITVTNSNSSFGGCASLSRGYKATAFPQDRNWTISRIQVPIDLSEKASNIRRIYLGIVADISGSKITLEESLAADSASTTIPAILLRDNYSLANGTRIWIENPSSDDWRSTLTSAAWDSSQPDEINITAAPAQSGTNNPIGINPETELSLAIGKRVYIRRLADTRLPNERRVSIRLNNTASAKIPERNFVLQTDPARVNGAITRTLAAGGEEVLIVSNAGAGSTPGFGVAKTAEVTLRRGAPIVTYANNTFYRAGVIVRHANKHYQSLRDQVTNSSSPSALTWGETFVHMPSAYNPEDSLRNEAPIIVFDTDTDDTDESTDLGINLSTVWTSPGSVRDQYRSGTDYLGAYALLRALGFTDSAAHAALAPRTFATRTLDPSSSVDFPTAPSGGAANGRGNWAVEFRRPSSLRLYGHAWEWAGYLNYSKAIPGAQKDLSPQNKFTYYFTNDIGGRVVPQGSNEDGFNVSPKGLEDIETGATLTVEQVGSSTVDDVQTTDFPNGLTATSATIGNLTITGDIIYSNVPTAKIDLPSVVYLADIDQITATGGNAPVSGTNLAIENSPFVVTIGSLNRWRQAQRLISADTGTITIFVKAGVPDRNLDSMFTAPPTTAATAIPTLARAAEYANAVIGGGNQLALIRIAPGLYDPSSVWQCNVRFESWNTALTARIWGSNNTGSTSIANNYFDGSGWDDFTNAVNFWCYRLALRSATASNNNLHIFVQPRQMVFERSVTFIGGFHCLGLAEQIKAVNGGFLGRTDMVGAPVVPAIGSFTATLSSNVDTLLSAIRVSNGVTGSSSNPSYLGITGNSLIALRGGIKDSAILNDLVIGPGLPARKDSLSVPWSPLISVEGDVNINLANFYIRGKTTITSAGMGVTGALPAANQAHYGSSSVATPWTWEQTYHTLIGTAPNTSQTIRLSVGSNKSFNANPALSNASSYFIDGSPSGGKILPNHIWLLTNAGAAPANNDTGPYFDQFIHAPKELIVTSAWPGAGESAASNLARLQGFVGRFGRNGYNSVKTRGFLGGNAGGLDPETGFMITVANSAIANNGRSIFQRAGISTATVDADARVTYDGGSPEQGFGLGNPAGTNPVITSDGSGPAALNVGLRSYRRGISTEFAITIPATNVIL